MIDIDLPPTDSKIVVNSFITDGKVIRVHLSKSISVLDTEIPDCNDARIILFKDNVIADTLYLMGGYYYSHIRPERGKKYSLDISVPDLDSVFCEDIIPEKAILQSWVCTDSVSIDENGLIVKELSLDFQDSAGPNYYEVELAANDIFNDDNVFLYFEKNSDPIITSTGLLDYNPGTLIFTDKMFDGKHCSVKIYFAIDWYRDYNLKIIFRSVSESYYKYKEKQFPYIFSQQNDIFNGMSEPVQLYSNIQGGYGIFAGYSTDEKAISIAAK